ncbi:SOUL family heme-binding protein [Paraglaciecola psychrophila]|uniref:SOUL family heme-binding protein n=1 Tax=Paraglaciecola psychrophila TaxID=326544 RepID=UPI0006841F53|nr:heme-binding protein [Paraglaciecola psychrophila]
MKFILSILTSIFVTGCSVVGQSDVATAPYTLLEADEAQKIEVRNYDSMVLVSTSMSSESGNSAFRKLFSYITGDNEGATEIAMTAPVIMNDKKDVKKGSEISMTAPVFMNDSADNSMMSFVMPKDFTLATTPKPTNPEVYLSELKDYKVASIQFSGTLSNSNVEKYTLILKTWITENGYVAISEPVKAGYNGPLTLPIWRRNEMLIEIK